MRRFWFQLTLFTCVVASLLGLMVAAPLSASAYAQAAATDTPALGGPSAYITNTFAGEPAINVRTGPSTITYPVPCGSLLYGATAPALGASPGHDWIQIAYGACPGGVGWIYAPNVELTGSLHVVEPPPTPTPLATATFDPTLVAAFNVAPTETRLPTFTAPAPLVVPTFTNSAARSSDFPMGMTIVAVVLAGMVVLFASLFVRR